MAEFPLSFQCAVKELDPTSLNSCAPAAGMMACVTVEPSSVQE